MEIDLKTEINPALLVSQKREAFFVCVCVHSL